MNVKQKAKEFYEKHEALIITLGVVVGSGTIGYSIGEHTTYKKLKDGIEVVFGVVPELRGQMLDAIYKTKRVYGV